MKVVISGASGLIGTELVKQLTEAGHQAIRLVRRPAKSADEIQWDPSQHQLAPGALDGVDAVVNLAGATTGRMPWTRAYKKELIASRLDSTATLVSAINASSNGPKVLISGSASGFYGSDQKAMFDESSPKGTGFLSDLSAAWEAEAKKTKAGVRVVLIRTTMVLSPKRGALGRLLPLVKLGLAGALGSGKQWWAWISLKDEARAIIHLIQNESASGVFNLTAPEPATCKELVSELAKGLKRPSIIPVPSFALRLVFGEAADELLLSSQYLTATKLINSGFVFEHPTLHQATNWVLKQ